MNDLYVHQLETENKQLREALEVIKTTNKLLIQQKVQMQDDLDMLDEKIDKANKILNKGCFEYDNCPDSLINEIIELKQILGEKENE